MLKKGRRRRQDHPRTQSKTKRQSHPDEKKKRQNHPEKATKPPKAKQGGKTTQNQRHLLTRPACLHLISPANLT